MAFLPVSPSGLPSPCSTPDRCGGVLIAFTGGWRQAVGILKDLKASEHQKLRLSPQELKQFADAEWRGTVANRDRAGVHLLSGFLAECHFPTEAIRSYGAVLEQALLPHDEAVVMAAYLRLTSLLARGNKPREALHVIEHFEKRVARAEPGTFTPRGKQRQSLVTMKPYLYSLVDADSDISKPASV